MTRPGYHIFIPGRTFKAMGHSRLGNTFFILVILDLSAEVSD
jgi:hypothetical protein